MKPLLITSLILLIPFLHVNGLNVYRYNPSSQNVTITQGSSITFNIGADDPYGLDFCEWYVGSSFQVNHNMTGYYDEDSWSKTFSSTGIFNIYCYVYNINGASNFTYWQITVQEPPIGYVQVISPNGGENWVSGSTHSITWSTSGNISSIDLQYTINNGSNWNYIASPSHSSGSYSWTLPTNTNSSQCKVKIIGYYMSQTVSDLSNSTFTISSSLTVSSPNGGESWVMGSSQNITWNSSGISGNVKIEINGYYPTGTWETLFASTANDGSEPWTVSGMAGAEKRIRISSVSNTSINDISNSNFSIINPSITITSPNGGESWIIGTSHNITWSSVGISGNVKIEINGYYPSGTWETLFASTANDGSEPWTVSGMAGAEKRIRITSLNSPSISDLSNSNFTITNPIATIISPNGGESYVAGTTQSISWSLAGSLASIDLQYTTDNGSSWLYIASPSPSAGTYSWPIPYNINSSLCKVKILGYYNSQLVTSDESNSTFTISSSLTVSSPNGGESWVMGSSQNITWNSSGISGNVKIEINGYYPTGTWETLFASTANDGSEPWTVSGMAGAEKRIRIISVSNASIYDVSDGNCSFLDLNNIENEFFDDFTYSNIIEPENNGWEIVNGINGPPNNAMYDETLISFEVDQQNSNNKLMKLSTSTTNSFSSLKCSRIQTSSFLFYEGTYAAKVAFNNASIPWQDGNVQTFYAIKNLPSNPNHSECDFEYLAYDVWGGANLNSKLYMVTWESDDPVIKAVTPKETNTELWHLFIFRFIDGQLVEYFIDDALEASHTTATVGGSGISVYPELPMQIAFANWIADTFGSSTTLRTNTFKVDWVYHAKDVGLNSTQIQSKVNLLKAQGVAFRNTMIVPVNYLLQNVSVSPGQSSCYNATHAITSAGNGTTFTVQNGGSATLIAGHHIYFLPGTSVQQGGYLHGYIAPSGPWCTTGVMTPTITEHHELIESTEVLVQEKNQGLEKFFSIYPNPTFGTFTLELSETDTTQFVHIDIYGIHGEHVLSEALLGNRKYKLSLENKPAGIYIIRVVLGGKVRISKLLKQ